MFKLLKELTRPPVTLAPPPPLDSSSSLSPHTTYTPRQRSRSIIGSSGGPSRDEPSTSTSIGGANRAAEAVKPKVQVEELNEDGNKVVELLKALETPGEGGIMGIVESLSQLNSLTPRSRTLGVFRRNRGFPILRGVFSDGLAWKAKVEGVEEEEWQVGEVQRMEGLRLAFEVLAWGLQDRESRRAFNADGGYMSLLPALRSLATRSDNTPSQNDDEFGSSSALFDSTTDISKTSPDPQVLAHLLAHLCNNNYTILSIFAKPDEYEPSTLAEKLGDFTLRWGGGLPLLWSYMWGFDDINTSILGGKGKAKATLSQRQAKACAHGHYESTSPFIGLIFRILLIAAQASISNLFTLHKHLPGFANFLLVRLYGPPEKREYDVTFPARDDWQMVNDRDDDEDLEWIPPSDGLRAVYLSLLRRVLEAGVDQRVTWRLFTLVKIRPKPMTEPVSTDVSRSDSPTPASPAPSDLMETPTKARRRPKPDLHIATPAVPSSEIDVERLRPEVLDLIRHAMKSRWPDTFVFRGGKGDSQGGIEMKDLGRVWQAGQKGFNFSCWVYITKANQPITLLHVSQKDSPHPLFQVKILDNSQISLFSSVHQPKAPSSTAPTTTESSPRVEAETPQPEELICNAPDALIPHFQWVHLAVGVRKPKGVDSGEARIFVNGVRVGAMRVPFPVAIPAGTAPVSVLNARPTIPPETIRVCLGREIVSPAVGTSKAGDESGGVGRQEENEWMLGRSLLVEEALPEDLVLLMHRLGSRYRGNFQEPLGKFLTYEAATSINVYLTSLAENAPDKRLFSSQSNSVLVKAIRTGPTFPEENILFSFSAHDVEEASDTVVNAAIPHPFRARQLRHGTARLVGNVDAYRSNGLDGMVESVGGGTVVLKMIDMCQSSEELAAALGVMREMIKECWSASEEMERIRGYEMLAAILRPKMPHMVDVACTRIILSMLGINMDKPGTATVHNSSAYRAIGIEFELWSHAPLGVASLYLQHFEYLLVTSKHARHNVLRTFQRSAIVKKMLYALRANLFDQEVVPVVVDTLKLVLVARWSGEDAIKPVFSFLVSALCQGDPFFADTSNTDPPPAQVPAALTLSAIANLLHNVPRLQKLNKSLAVHRLLVILISSNSAYYVILPCLDVLERCLSTAGLESFQRNFESEGGFALLARTLGPVWRDDVQAFVMRIMVGADGGKGSSLACTPLVSTVLAALDYLLSSAGDEETSTRPVNGRTRSGTITSIRSVAMSPMVAESNLNGDADTRLRDLLKEMTAIYRASAPFRRLFTGRRIEQMLPNLADFAAVSASGAAGSPGAYKSQRSAAAEWLQAIIELSKLQTSLINQMKLIQEQLRTPASPRPASLMLSRTSSRSSVNLASTPTTSAFGSSLSRYPSHSSISGPSTIPRRRPSTDAGVGMTSRPRSIMERTPLKRTLTGESVLEGGKDKNSAWKLIIIQTDLQAHGKMVIERKEHWQRLSQVDWPKLATGLRSENGLWPDAEGPVTWRIDGSEGPLRMRNRLERINAPPDAGIARTRYKLRDAIPSVEDLSSAVSRMNVAPWEDPFALALGQAAPIAEEESPLAAPAVTPGQASSETTAPRDDDESYVEVEDNKDDKMRRIAKTLEAGDVVEEAHNIVRIVGVDACPGLLILGKRNLYLVDGLVQTADGEVIDAKDAPRDVLTIPGTLAELEGDQQSYRWSYNEIVENNKRAFLFRDVALELYFSDKRNFLIVFRDRRERQAVVTKLSYKNEQSGAITRSVIGNFVLDQVRAINERPEQQLEAMTRRWQSREISNFAYLQLLNQHANRTPNDVTQYPVFPWVLADYSSLQLELDKDATFRDLKMPMGALTPARREAAEERYSATEGVGEKPFHYGTHYTSSMIVCGFLIRLSPFTEIFLALQGGNFDLADRLFSSIPRAWDSASADNRGDVRELIPEFFYSSAFMINLNRHDFGRKQISGDSVDNVVLPPWALEDPLLFVHRHREALESEHVSKQLPHWIDITFGHKQRDPASFNCFHPLSYRGAVDLETMEDDTEKAASTAIIHNFGQTPLQIFKVPHPHRFLSGRSSLPVGTRYGVAEGWQILMRSILPITETTTPIHDLTETNGGAEVKPMSQQKYRLVITGTMLSVQFGFVDGSLRVYYQESMASVPRLVHLVEGISVENAILVGPTLLATASESGVITIWRLNIKGSGSRRGDVALQREATLRGHTKSITCLAASTAWSFLVSGSEDGTAMIWDMNRLRYTRTLQTDHAESIQFCAINDADGHIAMASKHHLYLFSLNGHPIASTIPNAEAEQPFSTFTFGTASPAIDRPVEEFTGGISFLKREFLKYGVLFVIGVGSEIALYRCVPGVKLFEDQEVAPWSLVEQGRVERSDDHVGGDCCMVKFIGETLYGAFKPTKGSSKYLLYQWTLPEGPARHVPDSVSHTCMAERCDRHFGLLEPKRFCGGCGGAFCGTHAQHIETLSQRYCDTCRAQLSHASAQGILSNRRDSAVGSSRRGSLAGLRSGGSSNSASRVGSRRPSVSVAGVMALKGAKRDATPGRSRETTPAFGI